MKKINAVLFGLLISLTGMAQQNTADEFFEKYAGKEGFTTVSINGNLLKMATCQDDKENLDPILTSIESIKILSADDETKCPDFYAEIMQDLPQKNYEELLTVKKSDQQVKILVNEKNGIIRELLLVAGGKDDNALIIIKGHIPLKKLSHLSKSLGMDELEVLEDVKINR